MWSFIISSSCLRSAAVNLACIAYLLVLLPSALLQADEMLTEQETEGAQAPASHTHMTRSALSCVWLAGACDVVFQNLKQRSTPEAAIWIGIHPFYGYDVLTRLCSKLCNVERKRSELFRRLTNTCEIPLLFNKPFNDSSPNLAPTSEKGCKTVSAQMPGSCRNDFEHRLQLDSGTSSE